MAAELLLWHLSKISPLNDRSRQNMSWLFGSSKPPKSQLPPTTALQQQRLKQIESLRTLHKWVSSPLFTYLFFISGSHFCGFDLYNEPKLSRLGFKEYPV